tara:strand:- start:1788 stop:2429 length:642 start_codon:yes stop_codon:yes gene_type:complete
MKIIEFIGLPCSGKTTLVKNLSAIHEASNINFHYESIPKTDLKKIVPIFLLHIPLIFFVMLLSPHKLVSSLKMSIYHCNLVNFLLSKKNNGSQVLVAHQGIFQSFASIFIDCFMTPSLIKLYSKFYFKLYSIIGLEIEVCYLNTHIEVVKKRLLLRKTFTSRFETMSSKKLTQSLLKYKSLLMLFSCGRITHEIKRESDLNQLSRYLMSVAEE